MSFTKRIFCFGVIIASLAVSGCGDKKSTASIRFDFSSKLNGSLSTQIQHIFVNVSAPNTPVVVKEWDCSEQNCSQISVDLTPGANRLVQLLVITEDIALTKKINYGDAAADLSGGNVALTIQVNEIGSFSTEARVTGQYIPSATHALAGSILTGSLAMKVDVGESKPAMKLTETEIFAGWFDLFALDNVGFEYSFTGFSTAGVAYNNVPIFNDLYSSGGLKISSPGLVASTNKRVHAAPSVPYQKNNDGVYTSSNFEAAILGFFGATNTKILCAEKVNSNFMFDMSSGRRSLCKTTDATNTRCMDYMTWSDMAVTGPGSVNGSSDGCTGSAIEVPIDLKKITERGQEMMARFGPFKEIAADNRSVIDFDSLTGSVLWNLNAGVVLPAGVEVFTRTLSTGFDRDDIKGLNDGILCERLTNFGFVSRGVSIAASGSMPIGWDAYYSPNLQIALCPRKAGGQYYRTAYLREMENSEHFTKRNMIEMALYEDSSNVISGFGFGGSAWGTLLVPEMLPLDNSSNNEMFLIVKNKTTEVVSLSDFTPSYHVGAGLDQNPASGPAGIPTCSSVSSTLQPSGSAANADRCAMSITFNPTGYNPGSSIYGSIKLRSSFVGEPHSESYSVPFVAPIYQQLNESLGSTLQVDFYAPLGAMSLKYIKLYNDSGADWVHNLPSPGMIGSLDVDHACPATLSAATDCLVKLSLNSLTSTVTNGSVNGGVALTGGSGFTSTLNTAKPTSSIISPYNFGGVSVAQNSSTITVTNNAGVDMVAGAASAPAAPFSILSDTCDSMSVSGTCALSFSVPAAPQTPGFYRQTYRLPYSIDGTYRMFEYELTAGY